MARAKDILPFNPNCCRREPKPRFQYKLKQALLNELDLPFPENDDIIE
jgi:hypothetical protein